MWALEHRPTSLEDYTPIYKVLSLEENEGFCDYSLQLVL